MLALLLTLLCAAPDSVERYDLPNGMHVALERDGAFPQIAIRVVYGVGSADDPPDHPGLAHLVEHLACETTTHLQAWTIMTDYALRGAAATNAMTFPDTTEYYATIPAAELEGALWLESDRMGFLAHAISGTAFERERLVVGRERAHRNVFARSPGVWRRMWSALFAAGHPYANSYVTSVDAVELNDVERVIDRYYGPRNATLILVGDLPTNVKERIEHYFGALSGHAVAAHREPSSLFGSSASDYWRDSGAHYVRAWAIPSPRGLSSEIAEVAARLLSHRTQSSAPKISAELTCNASVCSGDVNGVFWLECSADETVSESAMARSTQALIDATIATLDETRTAAANRAAAVRRIVMRQSFHDRAFALARAEHLLGPPVDGADAIAVTRAEIVDFLQTLRREVEWSHG